eukprot:Hpha_TRINITY_DN26425_c0_g1::TRINITY_DN26425_c0_g1_i1::g.34040::m.34040
MPAMRSPLLLLRRGVGVGLRAGGRGRAARPRAGRSVRHASDGVARNPGWSGDIFSGTFITLGMMYVVWYTLVALTGGSDLKLEFSLPEVRDDLEDVLSSNPSAGPLFVRLCFAACTSLDVNAYLRKDECYRNRGTIVHPTELAYPVNKGLGRAVTLLREVKEKHPTMSWADLIVFAANVAILHAGGPRIPFCCGRADKGEEESAPEGRQPEMGQPMFDFRRRMYKVGLNDKTIVALMGLHAMGEMHKNVVGEDGVWVPNKSDLSNSYFKELLVREWEPLPKNPMVFKDSKSPKSNVRALHADVQLLRDPMFRAWCERFAEDEELWRDTVTQGMRDMSENGFGSTLSPTLFY